MGGRRQLEGRARGDRAAGKHRRCEAGTQDMEREASVAFLHAQNRPLHRVGVRQPDTDLLRSSALRASPHVHCADYR